MHRAVQDFLERLIVLPHAAVGGIGPSPSTHPLVVRMVVRSPLQMKRGQTPATPAESNRFEVP